MQSKPEFKLDTVTFVDTPPPPRLRNPNKSYATVIGGVWFMYKMRYMWGPKKRKWELVPVADNKNMAKMSRGFANQAYMMGDEDGYKRANEIATCYEKGLINNHKVSALTKAQKRRRRKKRKKEEDFDNGMREMRVAGLLKEFKESDALM